MERLDMKLRSLEKLKKLKSPLSEEAVPLRTAPK
jgi:hypothetical protein